MKKISKKVNKKVIVSVICVIAAIGCLCCYAYFHNDNGTKITYTNTLPDGETGTVDVSVDVSQEKIQEYNDIARDISKNVAKYEVEDANLESGTDEEITSTIDETREQNGTAIVTNGGSEDLEISPSREDVDFDSLDYGDLAYFIEDGELKIVGKFPEMDDSLIKTIKKNIMNKNELYIKKTITLYVNDVWEPILSYAYEFDADTGVVSSANGKDITSSLDFNVSENDDSLSFFEKYFNNEGMPSSLSVVNSASMEEYIFPAYELDGSNCTIVDKYASEFGISNVNNVVFSVQLDSSMENIEYLSVDFDGETADGKSVKSSINYLVQ